jgi:flagellar M-ring protein FliF
MEQLQKLLGSLSDAAGRLRAQNRQTFNLVALALVLGVAICATLYFINPGAPVVLASNLSPADRTALALRLRRHSIDFTLGTDSITVPAHELSEARMVLGSSPGFSGGADDFSLFDRSTMGQSDFDEQVNYQRSLQGELERTIMDLRGIDSARVMLAMGRPSPFALGPREATRASVMLTTAPGASLDATMARTIAHLVAGSVRGLSVEDVTITANDGVILYPQPHEGELGEALRLRNDFEHRLEEKVSDLLTRIMGANRYAVEVSVDVDTSRISSHDQVYGKGDQTILSEEHSVTPAASLPGGIPGLTSNLPTPAPLPTPQASASPTQVTTQSTRLQSETQNRDLARKDIVNYKPSSREVNTIIAPVRIKRISVAAVLDGTYENDHFKPLPDERLNAIKGLVVAAVGADLIRGDTVDVQSAALSQPYVPPVPNPVTQLRSLLSNPVHLYSAIGALLALILLMIWMIKRSFSRRLERRRLARIAGEEAPTALAGPSEPALQVSQPQSGQITQSEGDRKLIEYEQVRTKINEEVSRNPQAVAEVLREWLKTGSEVGPRSEAETPA